MTAQPARWSIASHTY